MTYAEALRAQKADANDSSTAIQTGYDSDRDERRVELRGNGEIILLVFFQERLMRMRVELAAASASELRAVLDSLVKGYGRYSRVTRTDSAGSERITYHWDSPEANLKFFLGTAGVLEFDSVTLTDAQRRYMAEKLKEHKRPPEVPGTDP